MITAVKNALGTGLLVGLAALGSMTDGCTPRSATIASRTQACAFDCSGASREERPLITGAELVAHFESLRDRPVRVIGFIAFSPENEGTLLYPSKDLMSPRSPSDPAIAWREGLIEVRFERIIQCARAPEPIQALAAACDRSRVLVDGTGVIYPFEDRPSLLVTAIHSYPDD